MDVVHFSISIISPIKYYTYFVSFILRHLIVFFFWGGLIINRCFFKITNLCNSRNNFKNHFIIQNSFKILKIPTV